MLGQKFYNLKGARLTLAFISWTMTSFICHECGKMFLRNSEILLSEAVGSNALTRCALALAITCVQSLTCLFITSPGSGWQNAMGSTTVQLLMVSHFLATFTTNYSMAFVEASTTFAIKMTEPSTMVLAQYLAFRTPIATETIISIPIIISGALIFCGRSIQDTSLSIGIVLAFISNMILAARNIAMKKVQKAPDESKPTFGLRPFQGIMFALGCHVTMDILVFSLENVKLLPVLTSLTFCFLSLSAVAHVSYSYISLNVVLKTMTIVTHSIANIFKRLLVVLLLYACGRRTAGSWHFLGLAIAGVGLYIYVQGKKVHQVSTLDSAQENKKIGESTCANNRRQWLIAFGTFALLSSVSMAIAGQENGAHLLKLTRVWEGDNNTIILNGSSEKIDTNFRYRRWPLVSDMYHITVPHGKWDDKPVSEPNSTEYLSWEVEKHPQDTDRRIKDLSSNDDVIDEAQRILIGLLRHFLGDVKKVMLIEIANYQNKGDPAIATGEVILLHKMNITVVFSCTTAYCLSPKILQKAKKVEGQYSRGELAILFQGGGNLVGYSGIDGIRQKYIDTFFYRRMIILSQSIWLTPKHYKHLLLCRKIYSYNKNLVIFLRDRQSLSIAKKNFKGVTLVLAPDMAFGIGKVPRQLPPVFDIIWLRRKDKETNHYKLPPMPPDLKIHVSDWYDQWKSNVGTTIVENAFLIASAGFEFLQRGRIVITDRLHGHILSTLMHIPHVLVDNPPYKKLSSFDKSWTAGLSNTILVSNGTFALEAARELLQHYKDSLPRLIPTSRYNIKSN